MKLKFSQSCDARRCGFTLIEVVLALGVFLVSVMALVGLLSPMLQSIDEIEKMDEINSVVNTVNAFLQASPDIAERDGGKIIKTKFNVIYEAVREGNEATVLVFRYYDDGDPEADDGDPDADEEPTIGLEVGFAMNEAGVGDNSKVDTGKFSLAAGPIYRVVLSASSVTPDALRTPRDSNTGIYALTQDLQAYLEGYLALEARIFAEDPPGPDGGNVAETDLAELNLKEPDFTFNTAIVR